MDESAAASRPESQPPRLVLWVALVVCAVGVLVVMLGAWRVAVWTDEPAHVIRYANLQEHGWYLLEDDFNGEEPGDWVTDQYVYAPVATQLMHGVNRVVGLDPAGGLGTSLRAYSARHLMVGVLGLVGVAAAVSIGRRLLGSWSWGLVAGATLLAIPMWTGLAMFDIKDVPAAVGYTLVTLALVELVTSGRHRAAMTATLTAGLVLAIGTRPGLWPGLAAAVGLALLAPLVADRKSRRTWVRDLVAPVAVASGLAYAVLLASYPEFFSQPQEWLFGAVGQASHYTGSAEQAPSGHWAYVPSRVIAVSVPPLLLVVGAVGCLGSVARWRRQDTARTSAWLLVGAQALLLPVLAAIRQSHLSDDLRQLVFATPAVALLLTAGWRRVATAMATDSLWVGRVAAASWSLALVVPVLVQMQMFPYAYAYAAPQASRLGAVDQGDWARLSVRELLPSIPRGEFVICYPE